jgi:hypothetical protein
MVAIVAMPEWYKGLTILLEIFTMLVAFGVVYAGVHAFKVTRQRKHLYFAIAFGLLSASFIGRLFVQLTLALEEFNQRIVSPAIATAGLQENFFSLGHVTYIWLVLAAYAILMGLAFKWERKREVGVLLALTTVVAATSTTLSWPFYMASLALLFCIAVQHFLNFKERRANSAYWIFFAFTLLTLEPLLYLLAFFMPELIAAGYVVRLIAYVVILRTLWKVLA